MKFTRLRLSGFKSFVEPVDLEIEPGLTGVVGPNGCGKSNLLEALRWVMGESSYKSMRAAGMDDVIFSGTTQRPARNMAEVMVTLATDNAEALEVSRRIEREAGSAYRINGRDVRARDVQLLFADASTGARSPALVRQGQIGEIINAKPQARRLILEEAAGITGLHTRRHEAELKLRAAEQNLARLDDVAAQLETQLNSLKRQARQVVKYRQLSAEIRKLEAAGLFVAWREAAENLTLDGAELDAATLALAEATGLSAAKLRERDALGERLPGLREEEARRAAALQRLSHERAALDVEERRAEERRLELDRQLAQTGNDLLREEDLRGDTEKVLARLAAEDETLAAAEASDSEARSGAALALQAAAEAMGHAQEAADASATRLSDLMARRAAVARLVDEQRARLAKLDREAAEAETRRADLMARFAGSGDGAALAAAAEAALAAVADMEASATAAEWAAREARQAETEARAGHDEARRRADRLQTEIRTLSTLLKAAGGDLWPPLVDQLKVAAGYEAALGAALGDDLDASADEAAPVHWRGLPPLADVPALPGGVEPLASYVSAPAALNRRLSHVGIVSRDVGQALQSQLRPGQRLVSREGDIWRWDGFSAAADAPSAAARRLAERNRLAALEGEMSEAAAAADAARLRFDDAHGAAEAAARRDREARDRVRLAQSDAEIARRAHAAHERRETERQAQTGALDEALRRIRQGQAETRAAVEAAAAEAALLPVADALQAELAASRDILARDRTSYSEALSRHDGLEREAGARAGRRQTIAEELDQWRMRASRAAQQIATLSARGDELRAAIAEQKALPALLAEKRSRLLSALAEADDQRRLAGDALAAAENAARAADQELRAAQERLAEARERQARAGARLEASRQRHNACEQRIGEALNCAPADVAATAGLDMAAIPAADEIERKLFALRDDRERLGAVNLRADEEAAEVGKQLDTLVRERDDLMQAIARLRGGISSLNREGRQRLLDAFGTVNAKFGELFTTLFGGGKAELQLIESDDPLEAGLEIVANPPGKRPTTLSLLSGGEQTLTALSLIFAVFLTNPSPICVLDEVDAPLDDHNVERFCNLLDAMLERTDTRFLIITHHALTMARMNRLYGVTMMERGVSQLVSVNLEEAERLKEAV